MSDETPVIQYQPGRWIDIEAESQLLDDEEEWYFTEDGSIVYGFPYLLQTKHGKLLKYWDPDVPPPPPPPPPPPIQEVTGDDH